MGIWQRGGKREEYGFMENLSEDRGIWDYGRDEGRERNMGIWKRGGKRDVFMLLSSIWERALKTLYSPLPSTIHSLCAV